jgi:hypothetical protein
MNARKSENYLAISRSSSASKSVEIFWAEIYRGLTHCKHVPCSTLTHSTNEDLLNIKRKGDPKSRTLSPTPDTTETRNPSIYNNIGHFDIFRILQLYFGIFRLFSVDSKFAYTHFKYVKKLFKEKFLDIREHVAH